MRQEFDVSLHFARNWVIVFGVGVGVGNNARFAVSSEF